MSFLDEAPFDDDHPDAKRILEALNGACPYKEHARMFTDAAGIPAAAIPWGEQAMVYVWPQILGIAANQGRLRHLVSELANSPLTAGYAVFQELLGPQQVGVERSGVSSNIESAGTRRETPTFGCPMLARSQALFAASASLGMPALYRVTNAIPQSGAVVSSDAAVMATQSEGLVYVAWINRAKCRAKAWLRPVLLEEIDGSFPTVLAIARAGDDSALAVVTGTGRTLLVRLEQSGRSTFVKHLTPRRSPGAVLFRSRCMTLPDSRIDGKTCDPDAKSSQIPYIDAAYSAGYLVVAHSNDDGTRVSVAVNGHSTYYSDVPGGCRVSVVRQLDQHRPPALGYIDPHGNPKLDAARLSNVEAGRIALDSWI